MLEILLAISIGIAIGVFTGLFPGIHVNLVATLMVSFAPLISISPLLLSVFIVAVAITHVFLDFIPSIFLGAPGPDQILSVLPGHRMLLHGHGYEAVKLSLLGCIGSIWLFIAFLPLMFLAVKPVFTFVTPYIGIILIIIATYMILIEKSWLQKIAGFLIFILSGLLGVIVFDLSLHQPLLGMLSGLFGISTLLFSLKDNNQIPPQDFNYEGKLEKKETTKSFFTALFSGSLTGLFPGLGSAQAAVLGMQIVGKISVNGFMILIGGISMVNFLFSIVTLYMIDKPRNGAIVAVQQLMQTLTREQFFLLIGAALITAGIATLISLTLAKKFALFVAKVDYQKLVISVIGLLIVLTGLFDGFLGLLVLGTATALGMMPGIFSVKRSLAMGCLLLPVIMYFI